MADENKIALFIDADNISAKYGKSIIENLQNRGEIFIRRIYGNWEKNSLHGWNEFILKYGVLAVQQMDFTSGKNATDMSLTIDAMDVLYQKQATIFAIVTGDSDFTPLAVKLRERGVYVIGLGKDQASTSFRSACNEFIELVPEEIENNIPKKIPVTKKLSEKVRPINIAQKKITVAQKSSDEKIKTELKPVKIAPVTKIISVAKRLSAPKKKLSLADRFVQCGQNGMRKPKKKLQQIHDVLHESARAHADANGFAPLNCAGHDLKQKNLGFGIKDFGYSLLHEFIRDFPNLYELVRVKGRSFRYKIKRRAGEIDERTFRNT